MCQNAKRIMVTFYAWHFFCIKNEPKIRFLFNSDYIDPLLKVYLFGSYWTYRWTLAQDAFLISLKYKLRERNQKKNRKTTQFLTFFWRHKNGSKFLNSPRNWIAISELFWNFFLKNPFSDAKPLVPIMALCVESFSVDWFSVPESEQSHHHHTSIMSPSSTSPKLKKTTRLYERIFNLSRFLMSMSWNWEDMSCRPLVTLAFYSGSFDDMK